MTIETHSQAAALVMVWVRMSWYIGFQCPLQNAQGGVRGTFPFGPWEKARWVVMVSW